MRVCQFLVLIGLGVVCPFAVSDETLEGKVKRVIDGDSILVVDSQGGEHEVQLEGIDAPEVKQDFGKESSDALTKLLNGKAVKLTWGSKDNYERLLAQVYVADQHVNMEMIKNGMAWHFKRYNKSQDLAKAETEAKTSKKGLWGKESPVAPWDYRKENKAPDKPVR
jgi:micrococcal nuclease